MNDLKFSFEQYYPQLPNVPLSSLMSKILGERDAISKNFIAKLYRENKNMGLAYQIYYKSALWKECVKPLLYLIGIKKRLFKVVHDSLGLGFICPHCNTILRDINHLVPHHKKYPPLVKRYNYKGFDRRIKLNHPNKIEFMCNKCHQDEHNFGGNK